MTIWIPMLRTEQVTTSASKSSQSNAFSTSRTTIHLSFCGFVRLGTISRRYNPPRLWNEAKFLRRARSSRSRTFLTGKLDGHRCGGGRGIKTLLTHIVRGWIPCKAAVVDAERDRLGNFELRLLLLGSLSHSFRSDPQTKEEKIPGEIQREMIRTRRFGLGVGFFLRGWERKMERKEYEGIERSVMAMEYGPHRDAYWTFFFSFLLPTLLKYPLFFCLIYVFTPSHFSLPS